MKDTDWTSTRTISDMQNITSEGGVYNDSSKYGYYINLAGQGEKMLAEPTVFGGRGLLHHVHPSARRKAIDPCQQGGTAKLYGIRFRNGRPPGAADPRAGCRPSAAEAGRIGTGIASAPGHLPEARRRDRPDPDLYVTTSGGGGIGAQTQRVNINPPGLANRTNMLFWKDKRWNRRTFSSSRDVPRF